MQLPPPQGGASVSTLRESDQSGIRAAVDLHVLGAAGLVFSQAPECKYLTGVDPTAPEFAAQHAEALLQLLTGGGKRRAAQRGKTRPAAQPLRQTPTR